MRHLVLNAVSVCIVRTIAFWSNKWCLLMIFATSNKLSWPRLRTSWSTRAARRLRLSTTCVVSRISQPSNRCNIRILSYRLTWLTYRQLARCFREASWCPIKWTICPFLHLLASQYYLWTLWGTSKALHRIIAPWSRRATRNWLRWCSKTL